MGEILTNLEFSGYRTIPAVNWSLLKLHDHSPAHYRLAADAPPTPPTPACLLGQAVHALTLEGEAAYLGRFAVAPEGIDRRTTAGKLAWAAFQNQAAGRAVLSADQDAAVIGMARAISRSRTASKLLARCTVRESTVIWTDQATGTPCKARPDAMDPASGLLIDLKSTADGALEAVRRDVAKRMYHGQLSFYRRGLAATGHPAGPCVLVFVESTPPHGVRVVALDDEALQAGDNLVDQLLRLHADCERTGAWPGYDDKVEALTLPPWVTREVAT